jgi:hypothetical protein
MGKHARDIYLHKARPAAYTRVARLRRTGKHKHDENLIPPENHNEIGGAFFVVNEDLHSRKTRRAARRLIAASEGGRKPIPAKRFARAGSSRGAGKPQAATKQHRNKIGTQMHAPRLCSKTTFRREQASGPSQEREGLVFGLGWAERRAISNSGSASLNGERQQISAHTKEEIDLFFR